MKLFNVELNPSQEAMFHEAKRSVPDPDAPWSERKKIVEHKRDLIDGLCEQVLGKKAKDLSKVYTEYCVLKNQLEHMKNLGFNYKLENQAEIYEYWKAYEYLLG